MQIILLDKVAKLGNLGDVVNVKPGYARNYLIPGKMARRATEAAIKEFEGRRAELEKVAAAKLAAVIAALVSICLVGVLLAIALGPLAGLPRPDAAVWPAAGRVLTGALLMALLTTPLAWVASARRGYLPAIGALLGLIVVTQIVTAAGAGGWFPYATPSLWLGMGGRAAAAAVTVPQLVAAVPVSAAGAAATIWWWRRAELS